MSNTALLDLDRLTGAADSTGDLYHESIDISAQLFALSTADVWDAVPLYRKNGFDRVNGHIWAVDDWLFSEVRMAPMLFRVDPHHLRDAGAVLNIGRAIHGEQRGAFQSGEALLTSPDVLEFGDRQTQYKSISSEQVTQDLTLPRKALGIPDGQAIRLPSVAKTSVAGRLVFSEWDNLFLTLKRGNSDMPRVKLDRFAACLKIALGVPAEREDVRTHARAALLRQICSFIENNLERVDLSAATLLDNFGVSRPTLYRMFEPLGGVRNYLTYRRVVSALFELADATNERGLVRRVCDRWNFSSPSNFNRTVQSLFGNSPGALLGLNEQRFIDASESSRFKKSFISTRYDIGADTAVAAAA